MRRQEEEKEEVGGEEALSRQATAQCAEHMVTLLKRAKRQWRDGRDGSGEQRQTQPGASISGAEVKPCPCARTHAMPCAHIDLRRATDAWY